MNIQTLKANRNAVLAVNGEKSYVKLLATSLRISAKAAVELGLTPGEKFTIAYADADGKQPVIFKDEEGGSKLGENYSCSFAGRQNEALKAVGTMFEINPTTGDDNNVYFELIALED